EETDRLEAEARRLLEEIDRRGGAVESLDYEQREIERSALAVQREIESGRRVVVGVNKYQEPGEVQGLRTLKVDLGVQEERARGLRDLRAARDRARAQGALDELSRAVDREANLVPAVLGCVRSQVTLGEISRKLEERYGRHRAGERRA
ncbi:MAG TPA: methylmalonyl-CoA mutase family protein, partial [Planctomycetota bacterium]|nr:methylmalonyl-CoA mutase family protein [Planctomycetota bacterium]